MSTTSWMPLMEPSRGSSTVKYDDVMAEFRANGRDSDTSSLSGGSRSTPVSQSCLSTPGSQVTSAIPNGQSNQMTPCSLCGVCPPMSISPNAPDFISVKDVGSIPTSLAGGSPGLTSISGTSPASQFASNMDILDLQNQFGAGLRKLLVDKQQPAIRPEASWPFLRRDFSQINTPATNNLESIWQLGGSQYARPNNLTNPIGGFNYQLQRLQQLRQKKPGFVECVFCRNNGEQATFYRSHELKDQLGRVICPVLRAFTCPCCGATGDNAHTIKYCPEKGSEFIPDLAQLKALRMASGKRRVNLTRRYSDGQELGSWYSQEQLQ